mgnify:CR=1 FL=1
MKGKTVTDLIEAVKKYANEHYNEEGWDFLVECWSDADIREVIEGCSTEQEAIAACRKGTKMLAERRAEVQAEVF